MKIRLSTDLADDGKNEEEALRRAVAAAKDVGLPLMVHHTFSSISSPDVLARLGRGDILTHCCHGYPSTIMDTEKGCVSDAAKEARGRGVLFDVGHGQGSFTWTVAEMMAAERFFPDTISTDLHTGNSSGPAYDLCTVMTKMLAVGMPFVDVVKAVTLTPATAMGRPDLGSLEVGTPADVTVLSLEDTDIMLEDCQHQLRRVTQRVVAKRVFRAGVEAEVVAPAPWPNPDNPGQKDRIGDLLVRDLDPPAENS